MEIELDGQKLKVYENGTIERWFRNLYWKSVKGTNNKGHLQIGINGKQYFIHRIVAMTYLNFDIHSDLLIDHINRIKNDNRVENLRVVNYQQNNFNLDCKGYYIVNVRGHTYYKALIGINNTQKHKYFKTEEEAKNWYLEQKAILHLMP